MPAVTLDRVRRGLPWIAVLIVVAGLIAAWRFSPLQAWTQPEAVAEHLRALANTPLAPLWILSIYLLANALLAPNTMLNVAAILALGSLEGWAYAMAGSLLAAAAAFLLGKLLASRNRNRNATPSRRMRQIGHLVRGGGVLGVATIRMVPVAPYSIVNTALGFTGVGFTPYMVGTALGLLPGTLAIVIFGQQLDVVLRNPDPASVALLCLTGAGLLIALFVLQRRIRRNLAELDGQQ